MLTVIALLFFPVIFLMSLYRLYQLPCDLLAHRKWLNPKQRVVYAFGSFFAYAALGAYTGYVIATLAALIFLTPGTIGDFLSTASALVGYPFVYVTYEWVYFYAFNPRRQSH